MEIVCVIKVKKWEKRFVNEKYFMATETKASSFRECVTLANHGIRFKEVILITSRKNSNGQALEIIGVNLEIPIIETYE